MLGIDEDRGAVQRPPIALDDPDDEEDASLSTDILDASNGWSRYFDGCSVVSHVFVSAFGRALAYYSTKGRVLGITCATRRKCKVDRE